MEIIVLGASGQLGSEINSIYQQELPEANFHFFNRTSLDITNTNQIRDVFEKCQPDYVINCAAYTQVDKAENDKNNVIVNKNAAGFIAQACKKANAILIHFSSDYVYHIKTNKALVETDSTEPKGAYAKAKLLGEKEISDILEKHIIIRTSWVYSSFGNNFVKSMIRLAKSRDQLNIVSDQIGTPTYARDLAKISLEITKKIDQKPNDTSFGIYNFSNTGITNWADFAKKIFSLCHIECEVKKITTAQYGAPAPRPLWSVLSKEKIKNTFDVKLRPWEDALVECIENITTDN